MTMRQAAVAIDYASTRKVKEMKELAVAVRVAFGADEKQWKKFNES